MHRGPLVHGNDAFWRGWAVAQCAVRPDRIVVDTPFLDQDLGLPQAVEDFAVEQLVSEPGIEAFTISVLPRRPWFDIGGFGTDSGDPVPHRLRHELRAIIRPDVVGHAPQDEQIGQDVDDVGRSELPIDPDRQAFPGELVDVST